MSIYDDEIDLRPYVREFKKRWWQILLVTLIAGSAAFLYSILRGREYEATATILLTRSRASLSIANQFPTITEPIDSRSRMEAMISIADSEGLAVQTLEEIHQFDKDFQIEFEELVESVDISSTGDTIQFTASFTDPDFAALIANTWAQNAVRAINNAYTEEQLPNEILESLEPARIEYQQAQKDLQEFLQVNQVNILQKQIDETSVLLDELVQDRTWEIAYNVRRKQKMEQVINHAVILEELLDSRVSSTAAGLGDALAVMRLRAEAFEEIQIDRGNQRSATRGETTDSQSQDTTIILGTNESDMIFNVQVAELIDSLETGQDYQRDLQQIIEHAENEKAKAEAELLELSQQSLNSVDDELFNATSSRLRSLQSQLEEEQSALNEITNNRNLTFEVYQALTRKEAEVRNNLQTSSTVTLAGPAVPPAEPASRGVIRNTAMGASVGFLLSTIWVIGAEWVRSLEDSEETARES